MSILLSFIVFPKPFVFGHALAIMLVFAGVFLRIYNTNKKAIDDLFCPSTNKPGNNSNQQGTSNGTNTTTSGLLPS